jgi:hypothetical protein
MTLPNDIARCRGVGSDEEGWREGCENCARRIAGLNKTSTRTVWMQPPEVIVFWCEFWIEQEKE